VLIGLINLKNEFRCEMLTLTVQRQGHMRMQHMYENLESEKRVQLMLLIYFERQHKITFRNGIQDFCGYFVP
jgi:hypothetical protein